MDARHEGGEWLVRIEDLDPPREREGAASQILHALEAHGLQWDGSVIYQSQRHDRYEHALSLLDQQGIAFECDCTRAMLGPSGACGERCTPSGEKPTSIRGRIDAEPAIDDIFWGLRKVDSTPSDITLRRKDRLYAYALAVVVDDAEQGISHVVRGQDLEQQTPAQIFLHCCLGSQPPYYGHIPLVYNTFGRKFSKQTGASALDDLVAFANLKLALQLLGQREPDEQIGTVPELMSWAVSCWEPKSMPFPDEKLIVE